MWNDLTKTGDIMEKMLNELIGILESQAGLYRSLLGILLNEKKALVTAKLDAVKAFRIRKEAILSLIHAGDAKRLNMFTSISDHLGCPSQGLTLTQLAMRVEPPFSVKLTRCATDISMLVHDIHRENELNKTLMTHSLQLIRASIDVIAQLMTPHPVYFHTGKMYHGGVCGAVLSSSV